MLPCTLLLGLVAAPERVDVPVPVVADHLERAVERGGDVIGVDLLVVAARPVLDDAAADEGVIGIWPLGVPSRLRPERSVPNGLNGLVASIVMRVEQVAVAGVGADEQRQRRRLVRRIAPVVDRAHAEIGVLAELLGEVDEAAIALERDLDEVERREVEAVRGAGEGPVVGQRRRAGRAPARSGSGPGRAR